MAKQFTKQQLTKKSDDLSKWYTEVVQQAGLAEYAPVKGCIIIRPYAYAIWERVQEVFNKWIKQDGVENAYFPLFIPHALLEKEKEHVQGFSPELAVVTIGGGEELAEPLVVRPTSETIMYDTFSKWISSWRDLPFKINQWCNIVRWEKRTFPFLRTMEFLWQEGHTVHANEEDTVEMVKKALEWYRRVYEELFAVPVIAGIKSAAERFAGGKDTYTVEALMPDGKALQGGTSHNLGQNFAKAFGILYQDADGKTQIPWQTSWGLSTRSLGGLFLVHGDDNGLILPPKVAPIIVAIYPIFGKDDEKVRSFAQKLKEMIDAKSDAFPGKVVIYDDPEKSFGWRVNEGELRGIPLAIPVGLKEVESNTVTVRYRSGGLENEVVSLEENVSENIEKLLVKLQQHLLNKAKIFQEEHTYTVDSYDEFKKIMSTSRGFIKAFWCENPICEAKIKEETKATTRVKSFDEKKEEGTCLYCGNSASYRWYFAQAY
ncbi:proline--tRNA ligase [Candidatus Roizmanbacteria bacterium]|nr:proline--tRNA ligase [Candidatus Roizmanbacteria bacterium]